MSLADTKYLDIVQNILDNGALGQNRTGMPAYKLPHQIMQFDLEKEFPILTTKFVAFKTSVKEILWIWQKQSNDVRVLQQWNCHVWDEWMQEDGTIGKAYGYQLGVKHHYKEGDFDQVDRILYDLKHNPLSRRIMSNIYNHHDLSEMHLYPCAYSMTFNVSGDTLNGILNQRSQDMLTANSWNVCQYAVLMHMFAQASGLKVGELVHVIADAHIYDRHIPMVEELLKKEPLPGPTLWVDPEVKDFYQFTTDSFKLENYQYHPFDHKVPVAI